MKQYFDGKWAVILGASSGFGAAAATRLAEAGLNIIGIHLDRKGTQPLADKVLADIQAMGRQVVFINMNAADEEKRLEAIKIISEKAQGKVHVLLHSLAFGALKPFIAESKNEQLSKSQIEMTIDVMATSLIYWAQDIHEAKLFSPGARIFAMTSAGSSRAWKSYGAVSAAKAALEAYIRQLALEMAPQGICCNAILAGVTDTAALRKIPGHVEMLDSAVKRNPMSRLTTPDDVAQSLVALSLPHCSFITGNTIRVDGGENIVE